MGEDIAILFTVKARIIIIVLMSLFGIAMLGHRRPSLSSDRTRAVPPSA